LELQPPPGRFTMKMIAKAANKPMPISTQYIVDHSASAFFVMGALRLAMPPDARSSDSFYLETPYHV